MRVALLCTGPSLPEGWHDDFFPDYGCVIALNTAGHRYTHHWLCGADKHILMPMLTRQTGVNRPLIGVITNSAYGREAVKQGLKWMNTPLQKPEETVKAFPISTAGKQGRICAYSMPNALHIAYQQAAGGGVDIYGMDCSEHTLDFSGQKGDHSRNRWIQETSWLREMWRPAHTVIYGRASEAVRAYLRSETAQNPFIPQP
jgi:hypothetical protein